jgi:hypothetical protein
MFPKYVLSTYETIKFPRITNLFPFKSISENKILIHHCASKFRVPQKDGKFKQHFKKHCLWITTIIRKGLINMTDVKGIQHITRLYNSLFRKSIFEKLTYAAIERCQ